MWESLGTTLLNFFYLILTPLWNFLQFVFYWLFDLSCTVVIAIFGAISLPSEFVMNFIQWGGVPPQALYVLNALGVGVGLSMLSTALLIRVCLNLIPGMFTRV